MTTEKQVSTGDECAKCHGHDTVTIDRDGLSDYQRDCKPCDITYYISRDGLTMDNTVKKPRLMYWEPGEDCWCPCDTAMVQMFESVQCIENMPYARRTYCPAIFHRGSKSWSLNHMEYGFAPTNESPEWFVSKPVDPSVDREQIS